LILVSHANLHANPVWAPLVRGLEYGQITAGQGTWRAFGGANGEGQLLPSGWICPYSKPRTNGAQTGFAVKIAMENKDQGMFPIGAQGAAAIYTSNGGFAVLRRIVIRNVLVVELAVSRCSPDEERIGGDWWQKCTRPAAWLYGRALWLRR